MAGIPVASIIIPTLDRPESLGLCLESLEEQTFHDYEVILVKEAGPLAKLRNQGARKAKGKYLVFIDDDVVCSTQWLNAIHKSFGKDANVGGVSGPAFINPEFKNNRDIFRLKTFKTLYDFLFCYGQSFLPGHITKAGAWTTGASEQSCSYEGEVHFLEACNMAYRADVFRLAGGFDETYKGIGDWSEPDLAFKVRQLGYKLWFSRDAALEHRPSKSGAFKKRSGDSGNRMANYELFSQKWIKPCFEHTLYKIFIRSYYVYKSFWR